MSAPSSASARLTALPMPRLAPVTSATRPRLTRVCSPGRGSSSKTRRQQHAALAPPKRRAYRSLLCGSVARALAPPDEQSEEAVSHWNFADVWECIAAEFPERIALAQGDRHISWEQFDQRADGV